MKSTLINNLIIILTSLLFSSCIEGNIEESGTINCQDYLLAENLFNDIGKVVEDAFIDNGESKSCPNYITMNTDTSNQDTIIIDFGDGYPDDCLIYGKEIRGKIIITYSGKYRDSLSVIKTNFDHFYINNNWIQGERTVTNNGRNSDGNVNLTIEISADITGIGKINFESIKTREWLTGFNTFSNTFDDTYSVSGSSSGNGSNGENFEVTITENLYVDLSCISENTCIITSGKVELFPDGFSKRIINYGDSICDCNYSVILNDDEYFVVRN